MKEDITEILSPELCAIKIFEISGAKFDPDVAAGLWPRILQHKWLMSEKLGRDAGLRVACIDFIENMEQASEEYLAYKQRDILNEMGAQTIGKGIWDTISDSQPPKQLVQRKIILPLTEK
ncbi:MAG: AAA family ATPase, partial [Chrysiogenales bacterium]